MTPAQRAAALRLADALDAADVDPHSMLIVDEAAALLRELASEPQWQPMQTAPRDGTKILVSDGACVDAAYWDYGDWCAPHSLANGLPYTPTGWRHLPSGKGEAP